ncbi:hypothetical protein B0T24DRAFT_685970, partial [Lasiosphaeria ovina]
MGARTWSSIAITACVAFEVATVDTSTQKHINKPASKQIIAEGGMNLTPRFSAGQIQICGRESNREGSLGITPGITPAVGGPWLLPKPAGRKPAAPQIARYLPGLASGERVIMSAPRSRTMGHYQQHIDMPRKKASRRVLIGQGPGTPYQQELMSPGDRDPFSGKGMILVCLWPARVGQVEEDVEGGFTRSTTVISPPSFPGLRMHYVYVISSRADIALLGGKGERGGASTIPIVNNDTLRARAEMDGGAMPQNSMARKSRAPAFL